jgi:hypothetical protein
MNRSQHRWRAPVAATVVAVLAAGGCTSSGRDYSDRPPRAAAAAATSGPTAYAVPPGVAVEAVRSAEPGARLRVDDRCDSRRERSCVAERWRKATWMVGHALSGRPLPGGNGMREFARLVVMRWPSAAAARGYLRRTHRELSGYDGDYYRPLRQTGPRRYVPGDHGTGTLTRMSTHGWRGDGLRRSFFFYFDDSVSGTVLGGREVLRRGPYVVDVEWLAADRDGWLRLARLPGRVVRALG